MDERMELRRATESAKKTVTGDCARKLKGSQATLCDRIEEAASMLRVWKSTGKLEAIPTIG
ncbi:MAG: hypothetical protein U0930_10615 [Pirellulales bacterium]